MNKTIYFKISRYENKKLLGSYVVKKIKKMKEYINAELMNLNDNFDENIEIKITPIKLTKKEFEEMKEFTGY
jgi:hypothetical protein